MKLKQLFTMGLAGALLVGTIATGSAAELDYEWYAKQNPDVVAVLGNSPEALKLHYEMFGRKEARMAHSKDVEAQLRRLFDVEEYAKFYPDVKAAFGEDAEAMFQHYISFGLLEARRPSEKVPQAVASSLKNAVEKAMTDAGVEAKPGSALLVAVITGETAAATAAVVDAAELTKVTQALEQVSTAVEKEVAEAVKEVNDPAPAPAPSSGGGDSGPRTVWSTTASGNLYVRKNNEGPYIWVNGSNATEFLTVSGDGKVVKKEGTSHTFYTVSGTEMDEATVSDNVRYVTTVKLQPNKTVYYRSNEASDMLSEEDFQLDWTTCTASVSGSVYVSENGAIKKVTSPSGYLSVSSQVEYSGTLYVSSDDVSSQIGETTGHEFTKYFKVDQDGNVSVAEGHESTVFYTDAACQTEKTGNTAAAEVTATLGTTLIKDDLEKYTFAEIKDDGADGANSSNQVSTFAQESSTPEMPEFKDDQKAYKEEGNNMVAVTAASVFEVKKDYQYKTAPADAAGYVYKLVDDVYSEIKPLDSFFRYDESAKYVKVENQSNKAYKIASPKTTVADNALWNYFTVTTR